MFAPVARCARCRARPAPRRTASADDARDFIADAKLFYRVVACGGTEAAAGRRSTPRSIEKHCAEMAKRYEYIKKHYFEPARDVLRRRCARPTCRRRSSIRSAAAICSRALVTYPDAREITTISLEHAGDPTRLAKLTKKAQLRSALLGLPRRGRGPARRCTTRRARTCASSRSAASPASCRSTSPA